MCSAAWSFHDDGYQLAFNRDEKWARPASLPPSLETAHLIPGICARDAKAGGTWLFTNIHGITLALLNAYPGDGIPLSGKISRGEIPLLAGKAKDRSALVEILSSHDWRDYSPCHLLLLTLEDVSLFTWDGENFTADPLPPEPYFTSSSVRPSEIRKTRTARFREINHLPLEEILQDTANPDPAANICPHRPDGGTASRISLFVSADTIQFSLTPKEQSRETITTSRVRAITQTPPPMLPQIPPTTPLRDENDNLWILFSHLSLLLGIGLLVPLIIYLVKKDESPDVAHHSREALNFHISITIYSLVCAVTCVGIFLIPVIGIAAMVFSIIAAVRASDPVPYRYPLTIRLVS